MFAERSDNSKRVVAAEMVIHKRRANKFYARPKQIFGAIVFDYIQNMLLPVIPAQETFYYQQLFLFGFETHDLT